VPEGSRTCRIFPCVFRCALLFERLPHCEGLVTWEPYWRNESYLRSAAHQSHVRSDSKCDMVYRTTRGGQNKLPEMLSVDCQLISSVVGQVNWTVLCYNLFPGRPGNARAGIDNNCCKASLIKEHMGSLQLDQWVASKQVKRCLRPEVYKLTRGV
jgi:hypothetical protein